MPRFHLVVVGSCSEREGYHDCHPASCNRLTLDSASHWWQAASSTSRKLLQVIRSVAQTGACSTIILEPPARPAQATRQILHRLQPQENHSSHTTLPAHLQQASNPQSSPAATLLRAWPWHGRCRLARCPALRASQSHKSAALQLHHLSAQTTTPSPAPSTPHMPPPSPSNSGGIRTITDRNGNTAICGQGKAAEPAARHICLWPLGGAECWRYLQPSCGTCCRSTDLSPIQGPALSISLGRRAPRTAMAREWEAPPKHRQQCPLLFPHLEYFVLSSYRASCLGLWKNVLLCCVCCILFFAALTYSAHPLGCQYFKLRRRHPPEL